ncbi:MAG: hypothetical protein SFU91_12170 [Chloroherpetonaceae bacterium]|nr:hypothetical protein [Chloroherpetonaceae bacterium]
MKKTLTVLLIAAVMTCSLSSCFTNQHIVGEGPKGNTKVEERQWYVLWGLVPLNKVDSQKMAGGAANYEVKTTHSFLDVVIGLFTSVVTVYPRTVEVTK